MRQYRCRVPAVLLMFGIALAAPLANAGGNPCEGIIFKAYEFIETQCVFNACGPGNRNNQVALDGLSDAFKQKDSPMWHYCELVQKYHQIEHPTWGPVKELIVACDADSFSNPGAPADDNDEPAIITGACVIAIDVGISRTPDFDNIKRYAIARGSAVESMLNGQNQHDELKKIVNRRRLYTKSFLSAVQDEIEKESRGLGFNLAPEFRRYH